MGISKFWPGARDCASIPPVKRTFPPARCNALAGTFSGRFEKTPFASAIQRGKCGEQKSTCVVKWLKAAKGFDSFNANRAKMVIRPFFALSEWTAQVTE